ncbi:unnamed protein product [Periconia digitata]|uniref:Uncharacterized protein n=1 Tax=Periconia digitata TaxID=1303443 RepID=A0A9W4XSD6_9PLEO|nr:unnamed protein product [Periconia digitata]
MHRTTVKDTVAKLRSLLSSICPPNTVDDEDIYDASPVCEKGLRRNNPASPKIKKPSHRISQPHIPSMIHCEPPRLQSSVVFEDPDKGGNERRRNDSLIVHPDISVENLSNEASETPKKGKDKPSIRPLAEIIMKWRGTQGGVYSDSDSQVDTNTGIDIGELREIDNGKNVEIFTEVNSLDSSLAMAPRYREVSVVEGNGDQERKVRSCKWEQRGSVDVLVNDTSEENPNMEEKELDGREKEEKDHRDERTGTPLSSPLRHHDPLTDIAEICQEGGEREDKGEEERVATPRTSPRRRDSLVDTLGIPPLECITPHPLDLDEREPRLEALPPRLAPSPSLPSQTSSPRTPSPSAQAPDLSERVYEPQSRPRPLRYPFLFTPSPSPSPPLERWPPASPKGKDSIPSKNEQTSDTDIDVPNYPTGMTPRPSSPPSPSPTSNSNEEQPRRLSVITTTALTPPSSPISERVANEPTSANEGELQRLSSTSANSVQSVYYTPFTTRSELEAFRGRFASTDSPAFPDSSPSEVSERSGRRNESPRSSASVGASPEVEVGLGLTFPGEGALSGVEGGEEDEGNEGVNDATDEEPETSWDTIISVMSLGLEQSENFYGEWKKHWRYR